MIWRKSTQPPAFPAALESSYCVRTAPLQTITDVIGLKSWQFWLFPIPFVLSLRRDSSRCALESGSLVTESTPVAARITTKSHGHSFLPNTPQFAFRYLGQGSTSAEFTRASQFLQVIANLGLC